MSSFSDDGASEISAFASIPLNDAFRRLPTSTHTFVGLSMTFFLTIFQPEADSVISVDASPCGHRCGAPCCDRVAFGGGKREALPETLQFCRGLFNRGDRVSA